MHPNLSFDQAPPISVPFRFFLTAPLFGIAAGLALLFGDGNALASRWEPLALGLTHLIVAGFLLQVMAGALLQFVPVVTGGNVIYPRAVAGLVHPALTLGTPVLVAAFFTRTPSLFALAALLLGGALCLLIGVVGLALMRAEAGGDTLPALRAAVCGLLPTVLLGIALALVLDRRFDANAIPLLEAHQAWGLGGWALTLLAGVSWSVVPMFQITPPYPRVVTRYFVPLMLASLLLLSAGLAWERPDAVVAAKALLLVAAAAYAGATLHVQARRKRKTADGTVFYFRAAMASLIGACAGAALLLTVPPLAEFPQIPVVLGILLLVGGFGSAVCGMLYKIVPFLVWLHLQGKTAAGVTPPHMHRMIDPASIRGQMLLHLASLGLLLLAPWQPLAARAGGMLFAVSCTWLLRNLVAAVFVYRRFKDRNPAGAGHPRS